MGNCMDSVAVVQHKLVKGDKMVPVLYYLPPSPPCRALLMLARMLGIEFDLKTVNILDGDHMKPEFLQINPQHVIPTLDDHGLVLWESRAIMTYLIAAYGKDDKLYPKDIRTRAIIDQRLQFDLGTLYHRTVEYYNPTLFLGAPLDESKKARLAEALGWFDEIMKNRTWTADTNFTVADISLAVTVSQIEAYGFDMGPYGRIRAWFQRCKEELTPFGYQEINQAGADILSGMFRAKLA